MNPGEVHICNPSWTLAYVPPATADRSVMYCVSAQGANVKTDYGPLLHTLAEFGWLLTCVLPTPIIRHDR